MLTSDTSECPTKEEELRGGYTIILVDIKIRKDLYMSSCPGLVAMNHFIIVSQAD